MVNPVLKWTLRVTFLVLSIVVFRWLFSTNGFIGFVVGSFSTALIMLIGWRKIQPLLELIEDKFKEAKK